MDRGLARFTVDSITGMKPPGPTVTETLSVHPSPEHTTARLDGTLTWQIPAGLTISDV